MEEISVLKEKGNKNYQNGNYEQSIENYTKAINQSTVETRELGILLKNRAAAYLKLNNNQMAIKDCNKCLEILPNDQKALFRRCQALENLEKYEESYRDALEIFKQDPTNKLIQPILERLNKIVQDRTKKSTQITYKIETMEQIAFDYNENIEKRLNAINNLIVLARENSPSTLLLKTIIPKIQQLFKTDQNQQIKLNAIRIIGELSKHNYEKTRVLLNSGADILWFLQIIDTNNEKLVNSVQYCIQMILNTLAGMDNKKESINKDLYETNKDIICDILTNLTVNINNRVITGQARDAIIELLMINIHYKLLDWCEQFIDHNGIERLLDVISELEEYKYESSLNVTSSTSTIASVCLARIYENMYYDKLKQKYLDKIEDYIKTKLIQPDNESKIRVCAIITALLKGPLEIGNSVIGKTGILEMILVMANTDDFLQQKQASECIIAAASKPDKAKTIINQGTNILKQLYKSSNDNIKIRALVGLCKLGSSSGTDASMKPFSEGSTVKLYEAIVRFLLNERNDYDLKKWAIEGMSYLTLDAEIKERLIKNEKALRKLIELAETGDQSCLFAVVTTLVNLCNAYEKQEIMPEMLELAKFAKQHIPQTSEFDKGEYVENRIITLGKSGVTTALVALSKTESDNSKELIARLFNALASEQELRGLIVAQGGVKVLIKLALNNTEKGRKQASQALARVAITINPEVAFPGQRSLEVIRPLITLLHPDCSGLENFEALMGLCNLAQIGETSRQRILKEGGLSKIEHYMYEEHVMLCRAAMQCITNLAMSSDVVKIYEGDNDKIKFVVSLILEEDVETALAAAGAVAIFTSSSEICCRKVFDSKNWLDSLHCLLANSNPNMQFRGVCIVQNIIESCKELTEKLMETDIMEILMALSKLEINEDNKKIVQIAEGALKCAEKYGVIKKPE